MKTALTHWVIGALLLTGLAGCALTSKGAAVQPRFFSPDFSAPRAPAAAPAAVPLELRLGMIEAASHLEERMAYRVHDSELGYRDDRRWSERPEEYLRRALERELFERSGIRRVLSGAATTLDVELTAFEEIRGAPPRARLALTFRLHDDRQVSFERSLTVERPLVADGDKDHAQRVASALGEALAEATTAVSASVVANLRPQTERPTAAQ
jgi:cholesterol transport system auxiliary component